MDSIPQFTINARIWGDPRIATLTPKQFRIWILAAAFSVTKQTPGIICAEHEAELCAQLHIRRRDWLRTVIRLTSENLVFLYLSGDVRLFLNNPHETPLRFDQPIDPITRMIGGAS
jgi:hypothetical protein